VQALDRRRRLEKKVAETYSLAESTLLAEEMVLFSSIMAFLVKLNMLSHPVMQVGFLLISHLTTQS
jgi:hypothetical protein